MFKPLFKIKCRLSAIYNSSCRQEKKDKNTFLKCWLYKFHFRLSSFSPNIVFKVCLHSAMKNQNVSPTIKTLVNVGKYVRYKPVMRLKLNSVWAECKDIWFLNLLTAQFYHFCDCCHKCYIIIIILLLLSRAGYQKHCV